MRNYLLELKSVAQCSVARRFLFRRTIPLTGLAPMEAEDWVMYTVGFWQRFDEEARTDAATLDEVESEWRKLGADPHFFLKPSDISD